MPLQLFDPAVEDTIRRVGQPATKKVPVNGETREIPSPFPSPTDWRDHWIYFLMVDRFNNPNHRPNGDWDRKHLGRQGGTLNGVRSQLDYIEELGAGAIWLSPVLKNPAPEGIHNYHGYGIQDFLQVDPRFGSDGTAETAEQELIALVDEAHARGIYVILDIVLNHAGCVFDYVINGHTEREVSPFRSQGSELAIRWLNGFGQPRADWQEDLPTSGLSPDDGVWPKDLQRKDFYRRRGKGDDDQPLTGDFSTLRELVTEYVTVSPEQRALREQYGPRPVASILIRIHQYLISKFDLDGFRIDTVKHLDVAMAEVFGDAIREYALSIGKKNFFTFGEIAADEETIARYVGRNSTEVEGFGIDAALDFPLTSSLVPVAKAQDGVERVRQVFQKRKASEKELISTHGEAGRFFVSFIDNHDMHQRFLHPQTPQPQLTLALGLLYTLQGIPCLYYGTEQALKGTVDGLNSFESVREALWGKPNAFSRSTDLYAKVRALAKLRAAEPALRYGRLYFREVSGNGRDFGHSGGKGGVVAFSRVLVNREVLVVANTSTTETFKGLVLVDPDLNQRPQRMKVVYSNSVRSGSGTVQKIPDARFFHPDGTTGSGPAAALFVELPPMEFQVLVPE